MSNKNILLGITSLFLAVTSCKEPVAKDLSAESIIPLPSEIRATGSSFEINTTTKILLDRNDERLQGAATALQKYINEISGITLPIGVAEEESNSDAIVVKMINTRQAANPEAYKLSINENQITIESTTDTGIFYGIQTLRQLLPVKNINNGAMLVATGTITDTPFYRYRGSMLDVARHFFTVDQVKLYIDYLAMFKMNVLHLHLTDDQGWRIEIKSWPKLTTHGGSTQVGGKKGEFYYTQEQYKEIIRYATENHITVIPEFDIPGHTNSATASYPELNGAKKEAKLYTGTEVGFSTLDTRKEITYKFVADVIREIAALTPGKYIHIGGDESHVTEKDDYIYFLNRIRNIVEEQNKIMIGWADISAADMDEKVIAQYWQKEPQNAVTAKKKNMKIIMSPGHKAYLDMQYNEECPLGLHWAGYVDVDTAYDWKPETQVETISKDDIIGIECPLWTETIETMDDIEFMVFPRLLGYAEIGWTDGDRRNWKEYKERFKKFSPRLDELEINYYKSPKLQ